MKSGQLQRELRKKRPFESPEQEAVLNLLRTNDQFRSLLSAVNALDKLTSGGENIRSALPANN